MAHRRTASGWSSRSRRCGRSSASMLSLSILSQRCTSPICAGATSRSGGPCGLPTIMTRRTSCFFQTSTNSQNLAKFSNLDYDRLMDEASVTADQGKRAQLLAEAEMILLREMPVLPIYFRVAGNLVSTRVKGWGDNLLNITYVKNLSLEK